MLQIWCGDPSQYAGGYPESLQIEVVFVAQEAPTTTTTPTLSRASRRDPRNRLTIPVGETGGMSPTEIVQSTMPLCATFGITATEFTPDASCSTSTGRPVCARVPECSTAAR